MNQLACGQISMCTVTNERQGISEDTPASASLQLALPPSREIGALWVCF